MRDMYNDYWHDDDEENIVFLDWAKRNYHKYTKDELKNEAELWGSNLSYKKAFLTFINIKEKEELMNLWIEE